jgi:hypothetical protein
VTVIVVEFDDASPVHDANRYLDTFTVTFDGLSADTDTVEFREYHVSALGVVVPPFASTVSKYCVA